MKKQILFLLAISLLAAYSCASRKKIIPHVKNTPGTIAINDQLMCDKTEATNFNWLEYMYWTEREFGENSEEYKATIPTGLDWSILSCEEECNTYNYRHPSNYNYPIVGITQEQAKAYSKWRSDRVFEYNLIKAGILEFNPTPSDSAHFSIENYFKGKYYLPVVEKGDTVGFRKIEPDFSIPFPEYSLPSAEQRLLIMNYIDSTDAIFHIKKAKKYEEWREYNVPFLLAHDPCVEDSLAENIFRPVDHGLDKRNKFKLVQNSRGNVAEWGDTDKITYGGGWPHNVEYVLSNDTILVDSSNTWTGFRNVCVWKYWKD